MTPTQRFLLRYAAALQRHGSPAYELEACVERRAASLGLAVAIVASPTVLILTVGPPEEARTTVLSEPSGWVDLQGLERVEAIADAVASECWDPAVGSDSLDRPRTQLYSLPTQGLATLVLAGASAPFFGGGAPEIAAAGLAGAAVAAAAAVLGRNREMRGVSMALQAFAGASAATLAARALGAEPAVTLLAGLIALMPGYVATVATVELASGHLLSGMARAAGAVTTLLQLGIGVLVSALLFGTAPPVAPAIPPEWLVWAAVVASAPPFAVLLGARASMAGWIAVALAVAVGASEVGAMAGPLVGAALGAWSVVVLGSLWGWAVGRSPWLVSVPGLLILVPGSMSFRGLVSLLDGDVVVGVGLLVEVATTAIALSSGLIAGGAMTQARRTSGEAVSPFVASSPRSDEIFSSRAASGLDLVRAERSPVCRAGSIRPQA